VDRRHTISPRLVQAILLVALFIVAVLAISWHSGAISTSEAVRALFAGPNETPLSAIVWQVRLPRLLGTACVGAMLAAVGSAYQALFRNPLAEPYVIGISSGAALGGVLALLTGVLSFAGALALPLAGFLGAWVSLLLVMAFAGRGKTDSAHLILVGVATGTFLGAGVSLALAWAGRDSNDILRWLLGDTSTLVWPKVYVLLAIVVVTVLGFRPLLLQLNALALGDESARRLGVDTGRLRSLILVLGAAVTGTAVGTVGIIGFVGLVAPHLARLWVGVDWRRSFPVSVWMGALLLVISDIGAQRLLYPREVPLGVITAVIGGPVLLWMLSRPRR
jgi:iron complex transport system permease protein